MHHSLTKEPPRYTAFMAYVAIHLEPSWTMCVWSKEHKGYVDAVLKQDIGNSYWWVMELPEPNKLITANKILSQYPELYAQLYPLLKEILI